jgi:hypothetical protein
LDEGEVVTLMLDQVQPDPLDRGGSCSQAAYEAKAKSRADFNGKLAARGADTFAQDWQVGASAARDADWKNGISVPPVGQSSPLGEPIRKVGG